MKQPKYKKTGELIKKHTKSLIGYFIFILCIWFLISNHNQQCSNLLYGLLLELSLIFLLHWSCQWYRIYKFNKSTTEEESKKYDVQFKRLAKYLIYLFFLYIAIGVVQYKEQNAGFFFNEITYSKSLELLGYNAASIKSQLQEARESLHDYQNWDLETIKFSSDYLPSKSEDQGQINFQVQGFTFPLQNIGLLIGEKLWGNKKKYINISIIDDSVKVRATYSISNTWMPVTTIEEYFENQSEKWAKLDVLFKRLEYKILEQTETILMARHYIAKATYEKAMDVLNLNYDSIRYNGMDEYYTTKSEIFQGLLLYDSSEIILDALLKKYPNDVWLLNERGVLGCDKGDTSNAMKFFDKALVIDSTSHYPCFNKYLSFNGRGILDSALYYLKKSFRDLDFLEEDHSSKIASLFHLAYLYKKIGNLDSSEKIFLEACNNSPYSYIMLQEIWPLFPADKTNKTKGDLKNLIEKEKDYIPFLLTYTIVMQNELEEKKSIANLNKCLSHFPNLIPAKLQLAKILYENEYQKGDSLIQNVIGQQPDNFIAYNIRAFSSKLDGNKLEEENYLRTALKFNKFYWPTYSALIDLLILKGEINEVFSLCNDYNFYYPSNTECNYFLAKFYYTKGNYLKSLYYFNIAESLKGSYLSGDIDKLLFGGDLYKQLGYFYDAVEYYKAALKYKGLYNFEISILLKLRDCYIQIGDNSKVNYYENELKKRNFSFDPKRLLQTY